MKKIYLLIILIFCFFLLSSSRAKYNAPAGQMKGVEVAVNEYGNLNGVEIKVLNWGIVTEPPSKMFGLPFKKDKKDLIQVDVLFKNAKKQPIFLASSLLHGTLISKDETTFDSDGSFFKEYRNQKESFKHNLLPGQPVSGTLYFATDKEIVPAKLVIRKAGGDQVIRIFLQRNLPQELIPRTIRREVAE